MNQRSRRLSAATLSSDCPVCFETSLVSKHTGQPEQRVAADSLRDRWFSAEEARDYGIIDHIVERLDDVRPTVSKTAGL